MTVDQALSVHDCTFTQLTMTELRPLFEGLQQAGVVELTGVEIHRAATGGFVIGPVVRPPRAARTELNEAIATVEDSRATHVEWRDKLKRGDALPHELIGDIAHHQAAIDGYDQVLDVLRRLRS